MCGNVYQLFPTPELIQREPTPQLSMYQSRCWEKSQMIDCIRNDNLLIQDVLFIYYCLVDNSYTSTILRGIIWSITTLNRDMMHYILDYSLKGLH